MKKEKKEQLKQLKRSGIPEGLEKIFNNVGMTLFNKHNINNEGRK